MLNPVLGREVKERMRSRRAVIMLIFFLGILALILYLTYRAGLLMLNDSFSPIRGNSAALGRLMYEWLFFFLALFVGFMAPGVAAGGIVGERERRTLHPLQVTLLRPRSIVLGKLGASLAFVTLLVVATAPLFAVPLVLGGVTPGQVLRGFVVLFALEVALASMATYMSAVARRVQFAIVAAYGLAILLGVGTALMFGAEMLWRSAGDREPRFEDAVMVYFNPAAALADAVTDNSSNDFVPAPMSALGGFTRELQLRRGHEEPPSPPVPQGLIEGGNVGVVVAGEGLVLTDEEAVMRHGPDGEPVQPPPLAGHRRNQLPAVRLWMIHVAFLALISAGSLWLAARRLRTPVVKMMKVREKS